VLKVSYLEAVLRWGGMWPQAAQAATKVHRASRGSQLARKSRILYPASYDLQEAEDMLAGVGEMGKETLDAALKKFNVVAPDTKNPISTPFPFNLMFKTSIGPKGDLTGYLRPETAQVRGGLWVGLRPDGCVRVQG